jgi:hypothetical protein
MNRFVGDTLRSTSGGKRAPTMSTPSASSKHSSSHHNGLSTGHGHPGSVSSLSKHSSSKKGRREAVLTGSNADSSEARTKLATTSTGRHNDMASERAAWREIISWRDLVTGCEPGKLLGRKQFDLLMHFLTIYWPD